jgi:hypothetical protein
MMPLQTSGYQSLPICDGGQHSHFSATSADLRWGPAFTFLCDKYRKQPYDDPKQAFFWCYLGTKVGFADTTTGTRKSAKHLTDTEVTQLTADAEKWLRQHGPELTSCPAAGEPPSHRARLVPHSDWHHVFLFQ